VETQEQAEQRASGRDNKKIGAAILVVLVLLAFGAWKMLSGETHKSAAPPKIFLVAAPPPPPPPPPKFEKPPPPKEQHEVKVQPPQPKAAPPQPSPDLKMEGPAGNGPSAFGAGKITSDDVSHLGTGGDGAKGMFNPFDNYNNLLKGELKRYLRKNSALRQRDYTVDIRIWLTRGGKISRFELVGSTGDNDTDEAIKQAMSSLPSFDEPPPANMMQPIQLRIVTAG
jgi:protein TonB